MGKCLILSQVTLLGAKNIRYHLALSKGTLSLEMLVSIVSTSGLHLMISKSNFGIVQLNID